MESNAKVSIKNTTSAIVMQMVIMVVGIILPRMYLRAYGSEVNGLVTSINQFISYFTIVEAGLASAGTNALYRPLVEGDTRLISRVVVAIKRFYNQVGFIFTGLMMGFAFLCPLFMAVDGWSYFDIVLLVVILGLHGTVDFFTLSKYRALLTADQRYYVVANATSISYLINFAILYVALEVLAYNIFIVRALAISLYLIRSLIINIYVRRHYKYIDLREKPDNSALNKRWNAMVLQMLGLAQTSMPVVVLTLFAKDLTAVSVYAIYNMVAASILTLLTVATNGVSATFGTIIAAGKKDELRSMFQSYETLFLSVSSVAYACMFVMYIPFVKLYTHGITDCEYIYPLTAALFAVNGLLYNLKTPAGILIGAAGVFKETQKGTIIQTLIAVVFCVGLTPFWGINGLLIGLILSNLYRDIELVIFMAKNVTELSIFSSFKRIVISVVVFVLAILPSFFFKIEASGYFEWAQKAVIVFIWTVFVTLTVNLVFDPKGCFAMVKQAKRLILKKK